MSYLIRGICLLGLGIEGFLKAGIFIQNCLGWIKIALVVFMVLTGFFVVFLRPRDTPETHMNSPTLDISQYGLWRGSNWNWGIISTAFFKVFYSYNGLQVCRMNH